MDSSSFNKPIIEEYLIDINDFTIGKTLGIGAYSNVCLCTNNKTNITYAAKILIRQNDDENFSLRFYRELDILIKCKQPTIVKFLGYSLTDFEGTENPVIIMENAMGNLHDLTLSDFQKLTNTQRQIILIGVARGMMILHKNNVIHRDLKLDNILIDDDFHPLISDFGCSKVFELNRQKYQSIKPTTVVYRAPEVDSGEYDLKADVYSFGIIMFEVVTGMRPYPSKELKNSFSFMKKVKNDCYRPSFDNISVNPKTKDLHLKAFLSI